MFRSKSEAENCSDEASGSVFRRVVLENRAALAAAGENQEDHEEVRRGREDDFRRGSDRVLQGVRAVHRRIDEEIVDGRDAEQEEDAPQRGRRLRDLGHRSFRFSDRFDFPRIRRRDCR